MQLFTDGTPKAMSKKSAATMRLSPECLPMKPAGKARNTPE
jgi:hypothetical protein